MGYDQIEGTILIEVCGRDGGRRPSGKPHTIFIETTALHAETDVAQAGSGPTPIRQHDVGQGVAIQVIDADVPRRPFRSTERRTHRKAPPPVVEMNHLGVRIVIAYHDVEISVAIHVDEDPGVRTVSQTSHRIGSEERATAVAQENKILKRPVTALHQNDVLMPVGIYVSDTDVRRSRGGVFQGDLSVEAPRAIFSRLVRRAGEKKEACAQERANHLCLHTVASSSRA